MQKRISNCLNSCLVPLIGLLLIDDHLIGHIKSI